MTTALSPGPDGPETTDVGPDGPETTDVGPVTTLAPGLVRILAPNPSPMTERGTNTYVLGTTSLCIIDPGPDQPNHLRALLAHIGARPVSHILVTHRHLDHSGLARSLSLATDAPVYGFGDPATDAPQAGPGWPQLAGGGEGIDAGFAPDRLLADGAMVQGRGWALRVIHTPGHLDDHICLRCGDAVFSGDHVMGWASSMVSPPQGNLTAYMASCYRLLAEAPGVLYPGHGAPVGDPAARIGWLLGHRRTREAQILAMLDRGPASVEGLTAAIYADTPANLHAAAARNVLAHLLDLMGRSMVTTDQPVTPDARFHRC